MISRILPGNVTPTGKANWITVKVQNGILMVTTQNAVYAYGPK